LSIELEYKTSNPALAPYKLYDNDAGFDLRANKEYHLYVKERVLVNTGVSVKIPKGYVGLLFPRSSLSKKGIVMANSVGVIDSDYRGEIMASLMFVRTSNDHLTMAYQIIEEEERIVQLVIIPIVLAVAKEYTGTNWNDTIRGEGGFGSTGK
jgi:dUTP pyrophosphatase